MASFARCKVGPTIAGAKLQHRQGTARCYQIYVVCHSGDILEGTYNNVRIPAGNFCLLLGATVKHSVFANDSIQMGIDNSTIGDDVFAGR